MRGLRIRILHLVLRTSGDFLFLAFLGGILGIIFFLGFWKANPSLENTNNMMTVILAFQQKLCCLLCSFAFGSFSWEVLLSLLDVDQWSSAC